MESTIWLADGFVVITGDIGSGKTTLIESFLAELPNDIVLAHISQTQLTPVEFLQALLVEFGFKPFRKKKVELLSMIKDFMVEQYAAGKKILLVIDEAQNLSRKVLEEVRLLSGLETQKEKLLRIIIAGQPELSHKLDSPRLQQLDAARTAALSSRRALEARNARVHRASAEHRRRQRANDLRARRVRHRVPLRGRRAAARQHACATRRCCARSPRNEPSSTKALVKAAVEELQWVEFAERLRGQERIADAHRQVRERHGPADGAARGVVPRSARRRVPHRPGQDDHRPHAGQRRADSQPLHLAASCASRIRPGAIRPRGLEQHQRRVHPRRSA